MVHRNLYAPAKTVAGGCWRRFFRRRRWRTGRCLREQCQHSGGNNESEQNGAAERRSFHPLRLNRTVSAETRTSLPAAQILSKRIRCESPIVPVTPPSLQPSCYRPLQPVLLIKASS